MSKPWAFFIFDLVSFCFQLSFKVRLQLKKNLCGRIAPTRWHCFHFLQIDKCRAFPMSQKLPLSCPAFPIRADLFGPKNRLDLCLPAGALGSVLSDEGERPKDSEDLRSCSVEFYKELKEPKTLTLWNKGWKYIFFLNLRERKHDEDGQKKFVYLSHAGQTSVARTTAADISRSGESGTEKK